MHDLGTVLAATVFPSCLRRCQADSRSQQEDDDDYYYNAESWATYEERLQRDEDYSNTWLGPSLTYPTHPSEYEIRLGAQLSAEYHAGWE